MKIPRILTGNGIIDEQGRLFGVINIVDALVVLIILAILLAGVSLVAGTGEGPSTEASTHVTLDLGTQPTAIAQRIAEGDSYAPTDADRLTMTDVYMSPQGDGVRTIVRARLNGTAIEHPPENTEIPMHYRGRSPQLGRTLNIETPIYNASGPIRAVGRIPTRYPRSPGGDLRYYEHIECTSHQSRRYSRDKR